ncbi:MAG: hypothetical protein GTO63_17890 [Anaerolineae bacterium]|nr:hypothetical protein [Anaerolineae bacterium]NIN96674.1 hypothetical protein [Anaerolineae bacterium]
MQDIAKGAFVLSLTPRALRLLRRMRATSLFVTLRWVQGPCTDDWCQPIPKLEIRPDAVKTRAEGEWVRRNVEGIDVRLSPRVAEAAARHGDRLRIDAIPFVRRFRLKGLTYALRPPKLSIVDNVTSSALHRAIGAQVR